MQNVLALGVLARHLTLSTLLTTRFETGPKGLLVPALKQTFPDAPCIPLPGQVNVWETDLVTAIRATGRKRLVIAGVVTDTCVPSLPSPPSRRASRPSS